MCINVFLVSDNILFFQYLDSSEKSKPNFHEKKLHDEAINDDELYQMEVDELEEGITVHMETDVNANELDEFEVLIEGN